MKTVVVTGALKPGIGLAVTRHLISTGYAVIGTFEDDSETAELSNLRSTSNIDVIKVDHADGRSIDAFCAKAAARPLAGYVNAQMYFNMENQESFDHDDWNRSVFVNLTMPNRIFRSLSTSFEEDSSVVLISSTEAFMGSFGASAYAATKAAIHNLVKSWANVSGAKRIRANAIAAGWIGGVMDTDEVFNLSREITPLGRLGDPKEVASVVEFLLSDKSSFVNGSVITVDGGYSGVDRISKFEFDASS